MLYKNTECPQKNQNYHLQRGLFLLVLVSSFSDSFCQMPIIVTTVLQLGTSEMFHIIYPLSELILEQMWHKIQGSGFISSVSPLYPLQGKCEGTVLQSFSLAAEEYENLKGKPSTCIQEKKLKEHGNLLQTMILKIFP